MVSPGTDTAREVNGNCNCRHRRLDGDKLLGEYGVYAKPDDPATAGAQVTFSVPLYGAGCPTFTLGVSRYFA
jgi:hypothetical protein